MGHLQLVVGGQKSGKSAHAAWCAERSGAPVAVIACARVRDDEFARRVERHRADRPADWTTLERFDLDTALAEVDGRSTVLVDALDTWLAETLLELDVGLDDDATSARQRAAAEQQLHARIGAFLEAVDAREGATIVVAGQPGFGVHAAGAGARTYVDLHGLVVQAICDAADEAVLMVAGRAVRLSDPRAFEPARGPAAGTADDLRTHGDTQVPHGCVDLAVNVEPGPPAWLADELARRTRDLSGYPDASAARAAVARRHGRTPEECLAVAGAAEALWLLPRALDVGLAACVHPSFTEPEAALRAAGVPVVRVWRGADEDWRLEPTRVPDEADLVVLGRPDNPTGVADDLEVVASLCRPGRTVVVDEAFAEFLDDAGGLADRHQLPGVVSVRSLTKLWGLAGLRVGYTVGPPALIARMDAVRQPWSSSTPALHALERLADAEDERRARAAAVAERRERLVEGLGSVPGLRVWKSRANFVLVHSASPRLRDELLALGFAARRGDTFPGLDTRHLRIAVRDEATNRRVVDATRTAMERIGGR